MSKRILTLFMVLGMFCSESVAQDCTLPDPPLIGSTCTFNYNATDNTFDFEVPPGYSVDITVEAWGGGAAGGFDGTGSTRRGGGGGGGYSTNNYTGISGGPYSIVVGAGGIAEGGNGGTSSYNFGTLVTATGGTRGIDNDTGGTGGTGNTASGGNGGDISGNRGGGGGASNDTGAGDATGQTGGTGDGDGGDGGNNNSSGVQGSIPGGGGGGRGTSGASSGNGAPGQVLITVTGVLPVELTSFSGKLSSNAVALNWQTASELNNEKFVIERSTDRRNYHAIGEVLGQGTTNLQQDYHFMDKYPAAGMNYYRLKQMDWDGQYEYSKVISVEVDSKASHISIVPNPAQSTFRLQFTSETDGEATVTIHDMLGKRLQTQLLVLSGNAEDRQIDVSQLPSGMYTLSVVMGNQRWEERLVIE